MTTKPSFQPILLLAAISGLFLLGSAWATPEMPKGLSLELFVRGTHETNYFMNDGNEREESYLSTGLSLAYQRTGALVSMSLLGSVQQNLHARFAESDRILYSFSPTITISDAAWTLSMGANVSRRGDTADSAAQRTSAYTTMNAFLSGELAVSEVLRLAANVSHKWQIFDKSNFEDLGNKLTIVDFAPYYIVSEKLDLGARVGYKWGSYRDDVRPDWESVFAGVFGRYRMTGKLSARLEVGGERAKFDSILDPWLMVKPSYTKDSWYLNGSLDYDVNARLSTSLSVRHGIEQSYSLNSDYRTTDSASLSASYTLTNALTLDGTLSYTHTDADTGIKADECYARIGAVYRINHYLSLDGGYSYQHYDSQAANADFDNHMFYLGMRISL